uniref:LamG-like jellyroll fold domain-containing protein n=1 Tax=viral metagenome TaxID=1070528 RepID=A0A6C0D0T4_9ZZZZ
MSNFLKNKNKNGPLNKMTNARNARPTNGPTLSDKVSNIAGQAAKTATDLGGKISEVAGDVKKNIQNKVSETSEKVKGSSTGQNATKVIGQVQQFMEANSAISKFVAVVLSILLFYLLFNVGTYFLSQFFMPTKNAKVLDGLIPSDSEKIVSAKPSYTNKDAVPILRSVNQDQGLEFTWDVWFFISDISTLSNQSCIFSKGTANGNRSADAKLIGVCPGVYISKDMNSSNNSQAVLTVAVSTRVDPKLSNPPVELIKIPTIPVNKWVHCAVRVQNVSVDVYINGIMSQRKNLQGLPDQNYQDTYIGDKFGFKGYISSLNYYAYALDYDGIQSDYVKGPNMKLVGQDNKVNYKDYLAMNWYYKTI